MTSPAPTKRRAAGATDSLVGCRNSFNNEWANPWLDHGGFRSLPLIIAGIPGIKGNWSCQKFYAWLRHAPPKSKMMPGISKWSVHKHVRALKQAGILVVPIGWRSIAGFQLLNPPGFCSSIPIELMHCPKVSDLEVIAYSRIRGMAGRKGYWVGTHVRLAEVMGCSLNTTCSAVKQLEKHRLIEVERYGSGGSHKGHGGGQNIYHFLGFKNSTVVPSCPPR